MPNFWGTPTRFGASDGSKAGYSRCALARRPSLPKPKPRRQLGWLAVACNKLFACQLIAGALAVDENQAIGG